MFRKSPQSCLSYLLVWYSFCYRSFWKRSRHGHMLLGPWDFQWLFLLQAKDGAPQRSGPWIHLQGAAWRTLRKAAHLSQGSCQPGSELNKTSALLCKRLMWYSLRWLKIGAAIPCLPGPEPSGLNVTGVCCLHASKPWAAVQTSPLTSSERWARRKVSMVAQLHGGISSLLLLTYISRKAARLHWCMARSKNGQHATPANSLEPPKHMEHTWVKPLAEEGATCPAPQPYWRRATAAVYPYNTPFRCTWTESVKNCRSAQEKGA